jgi:hypothetical protein
MNFALPVQFERRRADHQHDPIGGSLIHCDHGLARFAQSHVVSQDGTPVLGQEFDPVYLVRIESILKLSHGFSPL